MTALAGIADRAADHIRGTDNETACWSDLRFGLSMGMIPSTDTRLAPSELDRLTDMVLRRLGRASAILESD